MRAALRGRRVQCRLPSGPAKLRGGSIAPLRAAKADGSPLLFLPPFYGKRGAADPVGDVRGTHGTHSTLVTHGSGCSGDPGRRLSHQLPGGVGASDDLPVYPQRAARLHSHRKARSLGNSPTNALTVPDDPRKHGHHPHRTGAGLSLSLRGRNAQHSALQHSATRACADDAAASGTDRPIGAGEGPGEEHSAGHGAHGAQPSSALPSSIVLIKDFLNPNVYKVHGSMVYDPRTKRWEGNDSDLAQLEARIRCMGP
jgi:hypothetical protein